ncbi:dynein axonemal assembly factor 11 [Prorops nasuta]|uniref:dynein axonemal assembly factor 11 n=1 Tax=Prorops nasuta TaxID=863751 RepID=UPI0034CF18AC
MVRITVELIRKRSEHNEGEISTLEEISLHQENIDKIEVIGRLCRNLKILLLQYNLISKIENLNMLKRLEYLNLALNNIEIIENLEGLESLKKLDLMVNYIGNLEGVKKLRCNEHLEQLILTGNPCTDYEGYREYVIATLPQLKELDMKQIERSERIQALQIYAETHGDVIRGYKKYAQIRAEQKERYREKEQVKITEITEENEEEENDKFWKSMSQNTPEDRVAIAERAMRIEQKKNESSEKKENTPKYTPKLFNPKGKPYNVNQAKVPFRLNDEEDGDNIILEVQVFRHLDTSHIDVDIQPNYVRVTVKGKVLQLALSNEILVDKSTVKRNITTGHLLVYMPRLNPLKIIEKYKNPAELEKSSNKSKQTIVQKLSLMPKRQLLEIGPSDDDFDFSKIVENAKKKQQKKQQILNKPKPVSKNFVDNPDVPPLE